MAFTITGSATAQELAQSLVGTGIAVSNVVYTGNAAQAGRFSGGLAAGGIDQTGASGIGFDSGIVLSTGAASDPAAPQNGSVSDTSFGGSGDASLDAQTGARTFDAAVLQFDFNPGNATQAYFNFVFGTDEYPNSPSFNDGFEILVNGVNVAMIPGDSSAVQLSNFSSPVNRQYYKTASVNSTNPDGFSIQTIDTNILSMSVVLQASFSVIPNQTNHIKFAIADSGDPDVDSFVFVQGGSLSTSPVSTAAPPAPALALLPASDSGTAGDFLTKIATPVVTGTGSAGNTIAVYDGATQVGSTVVGAEGNWSVTTATLADGSHLLTATQTDGSSAVSPASPMLTLTIDTTAPTAPGTAPALAAASDSGTRGDGTTNVTTPTITGSAESGSTVTLYDTDGTTVLGTATAASDGAYSIVSSALSAGVHGLTVTATDPAGNVSAPSQAFTLTVDTVAPLVTAALRDDTGSSHTDGLTSDPALAGRSDPGAIVTVTEGSTTLGMVTVDTDGNWSVAPIGLNDGRHAMTVTATDAAGNQSAVQVSLTLDTIAPAAAALLEIAPARDSGVRGDRITNVAAAVITGMAEPGSTITLHDGDSDIGTATVALDGTWSIASSGLADGPHSITASATDPAGNSSSLSGTLVLTIDTVPPALKAGLLNDTGSSAADRITSDATLTGSGDANAVVTIVEGIGVLGTTLADATGRWTFAPQHLALGAHTLIASEMDAAGNRSTAQINIVLDASAAAVPSDVIPINGTVSGLARFFDAVNGTQFYTSSLAEYAAVLANRPDLTQEANDLNALNPASVADDPNASPVFRFFDVAHGTHFFTTDAGERDSVIADRSDMRFEGVGFFEHTVQQTGDTAVYRFFDMSHGTHFYTTSESERASIISSRPDLVAEGIGFYAPKVS